MAVLSHLIIGPKMKSQGSLANRLRELCEADSSGTCASSSPVTASFFCKDAAVP